MRYVVPIVCAMAWTILFSAEALAQANSPPYPSRPVTMIVPFAAGGPVDLETRKYTPRLGELIGQQVIVDYKPGAGTSVGAGYVAKAKPDGYTLLSDSSALAVFPAFFKDLPFDLLKDLAPLTMMSTLNSVVMVPASSSIRTFAEYLAYAKAHPGVLNYGTSGVGDISHLSGMWLHSLAGVQVTFVPFKGTGPAMTELLAGRIDVTSASLVLSLPLIRAGKVRALAMKGPQRVKPLPDVPTVGEHNLPEYIDQNWIGMLAPAGTPAPILDKLSDALIKVTKHPAIVADLEALASTPVGNTPAQFKVFLADEVARWKRLVAETGITLQQ